MRRIPILCLALCLLLTACGAAAAGTETAAGTELGVYFFAAGAADAIAITTENSTVVIDCGEKGFGKEIVSWLEERGIDYIDYLIITHFDQDHVGGAAKVINSVTVGTVLQSNCPKDSSEYEKYAAALENAGLEAVTVTSAMTFTLDGVTYTVDPPRSGSYDEDASNNSSLIVSVVNGGDRLLFLGDAMTERLEEFLDTNSDTYDFIKVPHHGREETLMETLIASVQPETAVITSSDDEPEDESTVKTLENAGIAVFYTRTGAVALTSTGSGVTAAYADELQDADA